MKTFFKLLFSFIILCILYVVLGINYRLYYSPPLTSGYNKDVLRQLEHLKSRRNAGAAGEMQQMFPEGAMFFESLYGLAWTDFISEMNPESKIYKDGMLEINSCLSEIQSDESKAIFASARQIEHGAFYTGWSNYLLGKKLQVTLPEKRDSAEIRLFKNECHRIKTALEKSKTPFLESYNKASWPADMVVCIASLALHDKLFRRNYEELRSEWLVKVKSRLDDNGLIPHSVHPIKGQPRENARGSSLCLMLSFLPEIDSSLSSSQYKRFKELYVTKRLGIHCIREYPIGTDGNGDVDSGPVIWGIGTAATIVSQRAIVLNQDYDLAEEINNGIEALGFPKTAESTKKFIWGSLDISDVFIAWTRAVETPLVKSSWWQVEFHFWSLLVIIPALFGFFKMWKGMFWRRKIHN